MYPFSIQKTDVVDMKVIDGGVKDRGTFFKEYSNKWYIKMFCNGKSPSLWVLLVSGYLPSVVVTMLAFFNKSLVAKIERPPTNVTFDFYHTNVIDIVYWFNVKGLDVYCSPGTQTRYYTFPDVIFQCAVICFSVV